MSCAEFADLGSVAEQLTNRNYAAMSGRDLASAMCEVETAMAQLTAARLNLAREFDRSGHWALQQASSAKMWTRIRTGAASAVVGSLFNLAGKIHHLPLGMQALAAGEITETHLRQLGRCTEPRTLERFAAHEAMLVDEAIKLDADKFRQVIDYWLAHADPDGPDPGEDSTRDKWFHNRTSDGRWIGKYDVSDELGAAIEAMVKERMRQIRERDKRNSEIDPSDPIGDAPTSNRRARAMGELLNLGAAAPANTKCRKPLFSIHIDLATMMDLPTHTPLHETVLGTVLPLPLVQRMRCDSFWDIGCLGEHGELLDLGRTQRLPNRAQRRALEYRDRGCAVPGCDAPVHETDAHHILWWDNQGPTDIANLVLLCKYHHMRIHDGHMTVSMNLLQLPEFTLSNGMPLLDRWRPKAGT